MDEYLDILIANLKVLAAVPTGGRLAVRRGQLSVDTTVHGQFLMRFWHGDSRVSTIQHVKNAVAGAVRMTELFMAATGTPSYKSLWTLDHVAKEMQSAEFGLRNLRSTYTDDVGTVAALHVISERLQAHCETIRLFLCSDFTTTAASSHEPAPADNLGESEDGAEVTMTERGPL
jgi:hypothetical protein